VARGRGTRESAEEAGREEQNGQAGMLDLGRKGRGESDCIKFSGPGLRFGSMG